MPPRGPMPRDVQVSKKLSWLLRHHIQSEGLAMNSGGYVNVQDVLNNRNIKSLKVSFEELRQLVASNDKQRFSMIPVSASSTSALPNEKSSAESGTLDKFAADLQSTLPQDYLIRANQGHSVAVDAESLLTRIDESNLPATCIHGTTHSAWTLIVSTGGLKRMTRQHVHFASGLPAGFKSIIDKADPGAEQTAPVISGMRNSSTVLIFLDIKRAVEGGIKFWLSENGVILTEGDENGIVPLTFFKSVEDRTGGQGLLVQDGKILKDAPAAWATKGSGRRGGRPGGRGR
ncbi:phosphotransferase KptA/Tpt1 [Myriangium duriaei CBS 260.36]|uniref:2'-phosphotransferase n=1 Tax=Myriangium duriaei CBS 260.36 TaxID=1168546 RepID=A0A9P4IW46_9PEZI|nr:phosphotransferase KptA/Tpt1 [Myriangium duriaei CBS 260.36]